jgi:hypothetical protein
MRAAPNDTHTSSLLKSVPLTVSLSNLTPADFHFERGENNRPGKTDQTKHNSKSTLAALQQSRLNLS